MSSNIKSDMYDAHHHGRTDGRTDVDVLADLSRLTAERAPAYSGIRGISLGELLADSGKPRRRVSEDDADLIVTLLADRERRSSQTIPQILESVIDRWELAASVGNRWPVIRSGEREPIPWLMRLSVYRRDCYSCVECGFDMSDRETQREWAELDHCIPWSAGGPDDSDNLRMLCQWCNQRRSNHIDYVHSRNYRPTTWWCFDCWSTENRDGRHSALWRDGTILDGPLLVDDHRAPEPVNPVFCAFCQHHSMSPYPLIGELGRELIAEATRYVQREVSQ